MGKDKEGGKIDKCLAEPTLFLTPHQSKHGMGQAKRVGEMLDIEWDKDEYWRKE